MIEILLGLKVDDADGYAQYRAEMTPLLALHGGSFPFDAEVAQVLRPEEGADLNRVFCMRFPSEEQMTAFFEHPEYLEIRQRLFSPSVSRVHRFGKYSVLG